MIYKLDTNGKLTADQKITEKAPLSCALGCFDGVHLGHRALINETLRDKNGGYVSAVWTFSEPFGGPYIENVASRLSICGRLGVRIAICEDFSEIRELTPNDFVSRLYNVFGVRKFVCGCDFRFGHNRAGSAETLKRAAEALGAECTVLPAVMLEDQNEKISSTYIRSLIANGNAEEAAKLLARPFSVTGMISEGKHIGRTMDFPTVNQRLEVGRVIPRFGVYCSACLIDGKRYPSVTNVGIRPTINADVTDVTCETHIIGKRLDLYGKTLTVELYRFIRPERQFSSLSELQGAIQNDCVSADLYFKEHFSD